MITEQCGWVGNLAFGGTRGQMDTSVAGEDPTGVGGGEPITKLSTYLAQLERVESALSARGLRLSPTSRLVEYRKAIERLIRHRADKYIPNALQAVYEVRQLIPVFDELGPQLTASQVAILLSGHYSHDTEQARTAARDLQFELFTAAICKRGALDVELAEPDIRASWGSSQIAIAAKRIKSVSQLTKRMLHANEQIERSNTTGVIVFDLSAVYNPNQRYLRVHTVGRAMEILRSRVDSFLDRNAAALRFNATAYTCAFLAHASVPMVWVGHEIGTASVWHGLPLKPAGAAGRVVADDFVSRFSRSALMG